MSEWRPTASPGRLDLLGEVITIAQDGLNHDRLTEGIGMRQFKWREVRIWPDLSLNKVVKGRNIMEIVSEFQKEFLSILKEKARKATFSTREESREVKEMDPKIKRLQELLIKLSKMICSEGVKVITEIVSELIGTKIVLPVPDKDKSYPLGTIIVPLSNPNSHNYPINKPCMIVEGTAADEHRAIKQDGIKGNYLPTHVENAVRLANEKEFEAFFEAISQPAAYKNLIISLTSCKEFLGVEEPEEE